jgi:pimeloyl-ACP methyl ester carboxylesterase
MAALVVGLLVAAVVYRDHPVAAVEKRWAKPPSQFVIVDGVRLHYREEGSGPPVVLLHANYASLFMWEPWATALKDRYRVIRVDLPAHGLTGPEPSGDYSLQRIQSLCSRSSRAHRAAGDDFAGITRVARSRADEARQRTEDR